MRLTLTCEKCGSTYSKTPSAVARGSRFCSAKCRIAIVSEGNRRPLEERFWEKVQKGDQRECWPWVGGFFADGYGAISVDGKPRRANRVSCELANGLPLGRSVVRHTCDNPACVNPDHLLVGTQRENMADKDARGRANRPSKLNSEEVQYIRDADKPLKELASAFDVSVGLVALIRGKEGHRVERPVLMSKRREKFG